MARRLIAGNWKMNGLKAALVEAQQVIQGLEGTHQDADCLICPPFTLISELAKMSAGTRLLTGAQTCHSVPSGAHTGDVSAPMLADAGASHVIVGHSERRNDHGESDSDVAVKVEAAIGAGLTPIICVGESLQERETQQTEAVVAAQIAGSVPNISEPIIIAYEPIWAIGTGLVPELEDIQKVHALIRDLLAARFGVERADQTPILYGGSMKPGNAKDIVGLKDVDGGLIGGASLKASDFLAIFEAARL